MTETLTQRWRRRAITLPVLAVATAILTTILPVLLVAGALVDVVRRSPWILPRAAVFFTFFLWCEVWGVLAALWTWMRHLGGGPAFVRANIELQSQWNRALLHGGCAIFGMKLEVEGEDVLAKPGPLIVLTRHVSTVDAVLPVSILAPHGFAFRFVLKEELLWDPCLDIVGHRLPNCFVRRGGQRTEEEVERVQQLLHGVGARDAVVVYPEGTRFTPARRERLVEKLSSGGPSEALTLAKELTHTLPPLTAGTRALLAHNPGADLVFLAHAGLEHARGFGEFLRGGLIGRTVRVMLMRVPASEIPADEAGKERLLAREWMKVDRFVGANVGEEVWLKKAA